MTHKTVIAATIASLLTLSAHAEWETIDPIDATPHEILLGENILGSPGDSILIFKRDARDKASLYWSTPIPYICDASDPAVMAFFDDSPKEVVEILGLSSDQQAVFIANPENFRERMDEADETWLGIKDHCGNQSITKFTTSGPPQ